MAAKVQDEMGQELKQNLKQDTGQDMWKDRMRWTRANAEVACQGTDAKVQEGRQDEMDKNKTVTDH